MTPKRKRGRPKKVLPGMEWLAKPLPAYLTRDNDERLREQARWIASLEESRKQLIKQFGGFGIPNDLAYKLSDVQGPEVPPSYCQQVLDEVRAAVAKVRAGNVAGAKETASAAAQRRDVALIEHGPMVERLRAKGHSEDSIAKRLAKEGSVSLSTAKRWLEAKK
jgi:hypothetical protein